MLPADIRTPVSTRSPSPAGLRLLSRWVRGLVQVAAVGLPDLTGARWSSPDWVRSEAPAMPGFTGTALTIDHRAQWLIALASAPAVGAGLWTLWRLWRLFGEYEAGRVFVRSALHHLRGFAGALLRLALLPPLQATLMALTLGTLPGQGMLVLSPSGQDYLLVLMAAVLLAIAALMTEAVRLAEDNDDFV